MKTEGWSTLGLSPPPPTDVNPYQQGGRCSSNRLHPSLWAARALKIVLFSPPTNVHGGLVQLPLAEVTRGATLGSIHSRCLSYYRVSRVDPRMNRSSNALSKVAPLVT